jgi:predicted SprT family Zn-dependent metalloprotease
MWDEVKEEAKALYPHHFESCEPELYQDSSYRHLGLCSQSFVNSREMNVDKIKQSRCIITISSNLGQDYEQIRKTLCHEMGHFVAPKEKHSRLWKARADKIGARWGLVSERLTNNETFNAARAEIKKNAEYKYRVYCPTCGAEWKYKSNCKIVQSPDRYRCSACKVSLKSEKI